jgi:hypothetical protein
MGDIVKEGNELINYFTVKYQDQYKTRPIINRNTAKWAARDLVDSFGINECLHAVDWYFYVKQEGHSWNWFVNNMEKLYNARFEKLKDDEQRKVNRARARAWLNG